MYKNKYYHLNDGKIKGRNWRKIMSGVEKLLRKVNEIIVFAKFLTIYNTQNV